MEEKEGEGSRLVHSRSGRRGWLDFSVALTAFEGRVAAC